MSLKSKFKTSSSLVSGGVWFVITTNSDGSVCRVKLRRSGRGNKLWVNAFRAHTADKDMEAITAEEDEAITANVFAEANVADWENMQPEDNGQNVPFSVDAAKALLTDPDWIELLKELQVKSNEITPFQEKQETEAGNS